jgi:transposase-like protein
VPAELGDVTQAEIDESGSATQLTSAEKKELTELRRDKRRLEVEVEILKRAVAYFARKNVQPASGLHVAHATMGLTCKG